jgi:tetratricopeptide (TPR) repeat protein
MATSKKTMQIGFGLALVASALVALEADAAPPLKVPAAPKTPKAPRAPGGPRLPESSFDHVLRLAKALDDQRLVLLLLSPRAEAANCTEDELARIVAAYEGLADPEGGANLLKRRIAKFPSELHPRLSLARLEERMGDLDAAIATHRTIEERFGRDQARGLELAGLLDRARRPKEALALLKQLAPDAGLEDERFWLSYATLAWNEVDDSAIDAYRRLRAMRSKSPGMRARLIALAKAAGRIDEALSVALEAYDVEGDASALLFAAGILRGREDWPGLRAIVAKIAARPELFATSVEAWLLRGDLASHDRDLATARAAYREALRLDPKGVAARVALIWDAIGRDDLVELRKMLLASRADAMTDPEFFAAYAVGLDRLGRLADALPFYERQLRLAPRDYLWALEVADVYERLGRDDDALALRRRAFGPLRREVLAATAKGEPPPTSMELVHANLTKRFLGVPEGDRWLGLLLGRPPTGLEKRELAIGWYLADERLDRAKPLLLRAHGARLDRPSFRGFRLAMALADRDRETLAALVHDPRGLTADEERQAAEALDRDDLELAAIGRELERDVPDGSRLRRRAEDLDDARRPHAIVGGRMLQVDALRVVGPHAILGIGDGDQRLVGHVSAVRLGLSPIGGGEYASTPRLAGDALEIDTGLALRVGSESSHREYGIALNHRDRPAPRLSLIDVRRLGGGRTSELHAHVNEVIEDVPFLRVAGLRTRLAALIRQELGPRFYAQGQAIFFEDHTRDYRPLGLEVGASAEAGYRILRRGPEWTVGLHGLWHERNNRLDLPSEAQRFVPEGANVLALLPPDRAQLLSVVTTIASGDLVERARTDELSRTRYVCDAAIGWLFSQPSVAGHVGCNAQARIARHAYLGALGTFGVGVAGRRASTFAIAQAAFTYAF